MFLVQHMAPDGPHQPAMTAHERGKSSFIMPAHKLLEQLGVAHAPRRSRFDPSAQIT
jgi:hypothetical protein